MKYHCLNCISDYYDYHCSQICKLSGMINEMIITECMQWHKLHSGTHNACNGTNCIMAHRMHAMAHGKWANGDGLLGSGWDGGGRDNLHLISTQITKRLHSIATQNMCINMIIMFP